ncbi:flagellar basal-body rod protein FlgF [Lichenihabitans sp. Uapishka_5]|uniref:flagellar basal-body rod protein FlgF n=1 Tax=Lichenihabitans sp. Uapishka_5 TaxID=3037302 RepID=UPI0029E82261|nr:flagellar basal-body rod protein FlgF [Lichenihabitans sp. Uapishka_5]MDX7950345.1 flagellar basal-body rod protein FlgF [Lichenihabitans sp. Uapishka_5]
MQSNFYVGMSGQIAIEKRLQTIASNVANMNTAGYRADGVSFDTVLSNTGETPVAFSSEGTTFISRRSGEMTKTDNPLDVATQGDSWIAIQTPKGVAYTHDGRMKIGPGGELTTLTNLPILDAGGSAMLLDPSAGAPVIAQDGMMTQGGRQVGAIGLFSIDPTANLTRAANSGVIPDKAATPILDFTDAGMAQGFVEGSNVNPILELSKLIEIQHNLDSVSNANQAGDTSLQDAIKTLGQTS